MATQIYQSSLNDVVAIKNHNNLALIQIVLIQIVLCAANDLLKLKIIPKGIF